MGKEWGSGSTSDTCWPTSLAACEEQNYEDSSTYFIIIILGKALYLFHYFLCQNTEMDNLCFHLNEMSKSFSILSGELTGNRKATCWLP